VSNRGLSSLKNKFYFKTNLPNRSAWRAGKCSTQNTSSGYTARRPRKCIHHQTRSEGYGH